MKLLIYSWAEFDTANIVGGGVSVYLKRIIPELVEQGVEVVFLHLSSDASDALKIESTKNCYSDLGVASFGLFNSPVPYPHKMAFGAQQQLESQPTVTIVRNFVAQHSPDVVNFHSLEGVPGEILRLKKQFPDIKWWFTAHNYHLVCQQIQLFQRARNRNCENFLYGHACRTCQWQDFDNVSTTDILEHRLPWTKSLVKLLTSFKVSSARSAPARSAVLETETVGQTWLTKKPAERADYFTHWRDYNSETVSDHLDGVIAVSKMQKALLNQRGITASKIHVLNPAVSESSAERRIAKKAAVTNVSYWGYSNPGTGLSLFLDSLELVAFKYPNAKSIDVLIVSDTGRRFRDRLALLAPHFNKLEVIRGYDHDNMRQIADMTDIAVISPILQETYCQVAAELYFLGVPVLASSTLGFAGEHIKDSQFVFESGSETDLVRRLINLIDHPEKLVRYWETTSEPDTLSRHVEKLIDLYKTVANSSH